MFARAPRAFFSMRSHARGDDRDVALRSLGTMACPKLANGRNIRAAPTATIWQRRRSDGNEEEGTRFEAKRWEEVGAARGREAGRGVLQARRR
jgi:hypothetical protein